MKLSDCHTSGSPLPGAILLFTGIILFLAALWFFFRRGYMALQKAKREKAAGAGEAGPHNKDPGAEHYDPSEISANPPSTPPPSVK
jgi:hypothetical protein